MLTVRFIRHGQSTSNAGEVTVDTGSTPLTALGLEQAAAVRDSFTAPPDLIAVSPFLRARQTAALTQERFPHVPVEIWPVEEFTYLAPERYDNTTAAERGPWAAAYWRRADPFFVDGPGAESLAGLIARVHAALDRLAALDVREVAMFGHGQFMKMLRWRIEQPSAVIGAQLMQAFHVYMLTHSIPNGTGFTAAWDGRAWKVAGTFDPFGAGLPERDPESA